MARKRSVPTRLGVESLEDRCLLSGGITEIAFPGGSGAPLDITSGPDGNLWFTQVLSGIDTSESTFIGRITPDGTVTEFPIPEQGFGLLGSPLSLHITSGPDGNLWFTGNSIGRITPAGVVTQFALPSNGTMEAPFAITAGPDGNIWFTEIPNGFTTQEEPAGRIARITPTGQITEFTLPTAGSEPRGIVAGPDGNLWFTEAGPGGHKIGRITPNGVITEFALPDQNADPNAITRGPDGNIWFTGQDFTTARGMNPPTFIGRISLTGEVTVFPIADDATPSSITAGSDGNLYFVEQYANKIGRITPDGTISEFIIPTNSTYPNGITSGPDGNVWFAEGLNSFGGQGSLPNQIGKFIVSVTGTPNQRYVSQLYLDLLHRSADPAGLAGWVSMLDNGGQRFQIVQGIENSPEYRNLEIQDFYHRFLNRAATPTELNLWQSFFNLGGTAERVEAFVIGSDEYLARHPNEFDSHAFLTSAYQDIFHRSIDDTGVQAWTQALANGMSRSDVALALLQSLESDRNEVIDLYGRLLHRDPDPSGFGFFTTALQNGLSNELATALLTTSSEYLASVGIASAIG